MNGNGKVGRPLTVLTDEQVEKVGHLAEVLTQAQIAAYLGIGERTFRSILARDERVSAAYEKSKAAAVENVASRLYTKAMAGDVTCMIFFLKTQAGWRETARTEITGADGGPIEVDGMDARQQIISRVARLARSN